MARKPITTISCTLCGDVTEKTSNKWVKANGVTKSVRIPLCNQCAKKEQHGKKNC